ncbi:hypothetical protein HID58_013519 [Brassica napus]|uniref:Uncharacterized protein n=1 Tax=Brassica napus TaxID=3708 RepID=A0ABQ8E457_BRANA|nr:hypothetical protein HID58_013519 [Brassica napus]
MSLESTTMQGYFLLPDEAKSWHNIRTANVSISARHPCFGNIWQQLTINRVVGYDTIIMNSLQNSAGQGSWRFHLVIYTISKQESFTILVTPKNFLKDLRNLEKFYFESLKSFLCEHYVGMEDMIKAALVALATFSLVQYKHVLKLLGDEMWCAYDVTFCVFHNHNVCLIHFARDTHSFNTMLSIGYQHFS